MKYTVKFNDSESTIYGYDDQEYISKYLARGEFYEEPLLSHIAKSYPGIERVVDVGSNIGNHAVFFHDVMAVKAIDCFEPNKENFRRLEKSAPFATCHNAALSDKEGTVFSVENPYNMGASYCAPNGDIPCKKLDSFYLYPDLIKIDAEGMECQVLTGAMETVKRCRPVMFVEHNTLENHYRFARILDGLDYVVRPFTKETWEMFEYIPKEKLA